STSSSPPSGVHKKKPANDHAKPKAPAKPMVAAAPGPPAEHHAQSLTDIPTIPPVSPDLRPQAAAGASPTSFREWAVIAALAIPVVLLLVGLAVLRPVITRRRRHDAPAT
ncbi:MAG: hypothetical protein ACHQEA_14485, partial [Gaiellales bacterium]